MYILRDYQENALQALDAYHAAGGTSALASMATGTGKSIVLAEHTRRTLIQNPTARVLIATHVRELIEQNAAALMVAWPFAPYGICSAGLGRRDHNQQIILGTIQSLSRDLDQLGAFDTIIVDEVHLMPRDGDGMYLSLLAALQDKVPNLRLIGLSATCFRLDSGYLHHGEDALFEKVVFDYGRAEGIRDGWLAPLSSKATKTQIDVSGVHRRGGEFIPGELERACLVEDVIAGAADEIVSRGMDRKHWLCFCAGIDHAHAVARALCTRDITVETVTADTPSEERRNIFAAYRAGKIRALTGVNVFSVGFDIPHVDLIAMLRPTCSPGLVVQQIGRGTRKAPGKENCLVLDFAGNIRRHGPVDQITVKDRTAAAPGAVLTRTCPECQEENALAARTCTCCGYVFDRADKPKHAATALETPILSTERPWLPVASASFHVHHKRSDPAAPPTLHIVYQCGLLDGYDEYLSFEGSVWARQFACAWWEAHGGNMPVPRTVLEAITRRDELDDVTKLTVARDGDWWRIKWRHVQRPGGAIAVVDDRYRVVREIAA